MEDFPQRLGDKIIQLFINHSNNRNLSIEKELGKELNYFKNTCKDKNVVITLVLIPKQEPFEQIPILRFQIKFESKKMVSNESFQEFEVFWNNSEANLRQSQIALSKFLFSVCILSPFLCFSDSNNPEIKNLTKIYYLDTKIDTVPLSQEQKSLIWMSLMTG